MESVRKERVIKNNDFMADQMVRLNRDHGFNLVIGDSFTPGKHCKGTPSSSQCGERACYGPNGALALGVVKETLCKKYGIV